MTRKTATPKKAKIIAAVVGLVAIYAIDAASMYLKYRSFDLDCNGATVHVHKINPEIKR